MLRQELVRKGEKDLRVPGRLLQQGGRHVAPGPADRGKHLIEHPFLKPLRAGQPAMNDQAVDVALREEGHCLVTACGGDGTFRSTPRMVTDSLSGIAVPQGLCHIRTAEQVFPVLLDHADTAKFTVSEYLHVHIHASVSAACSTSLGLVVSSL